MSTPPRPPVTPAELEATKLRLRELAADVARTEEKIATTFDRLIATSGDPDGHRRRVADEARRVATVERARAAGADVPLRE